MARLDPERLAAWRTVNRAHAVVKRQLEIALGDRELPLPWFEILLCLQEAGGRLRALELAEQLMVNKSSLTRQLDRLEEEGHIRRDKGTDDDGRSVLVVLTRHGRETYRRGMTRYQSVVHKSFAVHVTDTDLVAVQRVAGKILEGD
ncbi:MAG: MarR family winged helix-turn-helix transcriptional regulator [Acidimicrobiia bacterium]